ncbi:hypothetical protein H2248_009983 [Termitomyces sp. 'cryptogamus']|nr:hypothetical protein H2248_009983 [Termitomyces sp. 'cryptogamus']
MLHTIIESNVKYHKMPTSITDAIYISVPSQEVSDSELSQKILADSENGEGGIYHCTNVIVPSKRIVTLIYLLCALAVVLTSVNVFAGVSGRDSIKQALVIDTLPRPDIFVGLPEHRQTTPSMKESHHHHNHTHGNSV